MRLVLDRKTAWKIRHVTSIGEGRHRRIVVKAEREEQTTAADLVVGLVPEPAAGWATTTTAQWAPMTTAAWAVLPV